jgi:hypothetical protein
MKKLLLVLTLTTLIFACKKEDDTPITTTPTKVEGCMDTLAINYDPTATEDDGSCEYLPTQLKLSSITINAMPMTNNGATWDWDITGLTSDPDVFYVLKQGGGDIVSSSSQDNISTFPISFTENLPYTINNLSQEYTIYLYDSDVGGEELMGSCSFIPNDFITDAGSGINITNDGIDMTLAIEWIQ